jgi:hypothetical protein
MMMVWQSELPGALFDLTLLEELNLNHNKLAIVNIEQDDALPNLKYCYLNSNQIIGVNVLGEKGLASLRVFTAIRSSHAIDTRMLTNDMTCMMHDC